MSPRFATCGRLTLALLLALALVGCDAFGKLFAQKKSTSGGASGASLASGDDDDGLPPELSGSASDETGSHVDTDVVPSVILGPIPAEDCVYPEGTPVGAWVRLRVQRGTDPATTEEWAVIGKQGDLLWVEEVSAPQDRKIRRVTWYLVGPDGVTRMALRGPEGKPVAGQLEVKADLPSAGSTLHYLLELEPEGSEKVVVPAGTFEASKSAIYDGWGEAHVAEGLPFFGLVRVIGGEEGTDDFLSVELIGKGTGRKPSLTSALPTYAPGGDAGGK